MVYSWQMLPYRKVNIQNEIVLWGTLKVSSEFSMVSGGTR